MEFYDFAIEFEGRLIGEVYVYPYEEKDHMEIGWMIDKSCRRKGFASEAALALRDFAVGRLNVRYLTAHCDCRNVASYKLMEKLGMHLEDDSGTGKYEKNGETAGEYVYSMTIPR